MQKSLFALPVALFIAGSVQAQQSQVFSTADTTTDLVEALEEKVKDDFEKGQRPSNGRSNRRLGWTGSVSASAKATSGNTSTSDVSIGARIGYDTADWTHDFTLAYTYGKENGAESANRFLGSYDAARYLNDTLFAYGDIRYADDNYGAYNKDLFVGVGLGFQVIDTATTAWTVQAGPGYRRVEDFNGVSTSEAAASLSSKLWWSISDTAVLSNDTDIIYSDVDTAISNDLGVNLTISGPLSLRTSLLTEYHSAPVNNRKSTDNSLGLSLIYTFN